MASLEKEYREKSWWGCLTPQAQQYVPSFLGKGAKPWSSTCMVAAVQTTYKNLSRARPVSYTASHSCGMTDIGHTGRSINDGLHELKSKLRTNKSSHISSQCTGHGLWNRLTLSLSLSLVQRIRIVVGAHHALLILMVCARMAFKTYARW